MRHAGVKKYTFYFRDKGVGLCSKTNQMCNAVYWNNSYLMWEQYEINKQIIGLKFKSFNDYDSWYT